ncbi:hypothetical protein GGR56DRAFT_149466 [Xylariaceae sp. FL0804]|nr:hypothetical protein GGR56DRAFT_149466 [Xylariaceae sp. FL0804]
MYIKGINGIMIGVNERTMAMKKKNKRRNSQEEEGLSRQDVKLICHHSRQPRECRLGVRQNLDANAQTKFLEKPALQFHAYHGIDTMVSDGRALKLELAGLEAEDQCRALDNMHSDCGQGLFLRQTCECRDEAGARTRVAGAPLSNGGRKSCEISLDGSHASILVLERPCPGQWPPSSWAGVLPGSCQSSCFDTSHLEGP